jgi:ATP-dependent Clp protease adaptor protein ClpS
MPEIVTKPRTKTKPQIERPKLYKVILLNDDFTPREFVVTVLKGEFKLSEDQARRVMITAHQRGVCVVAVFTKDVAETKATRATDAGKAKGYPLMFTTWRSSAVRVLPSPLVGEGGRAQLGRMRGVPAWRRRHSVQHPSSVLALRANPPSPTRGEG